MIAQAIFAVSILSDVSRDGVRVLTTSCADLDAFKRLPAGVTFDGATFGLSGWNSDFGSAYYRSDRPIAFAANREGK